MKTKLMSFLIFLCFLMSLLIGCGGNSVTAIMLSQEAVELKIGENTKLDVTFVPEGSTIDVSWQSANEQIAIVDDDGNITALTAGTTTIVCSTEDGIMDSCEITVTTPTPIDKLSADEKLLLDFLISDMLPLFSNPDSVRIMNIEYVAPQGAEEDHSDKINLWLTIQFISGVNTTYQGEVWAIYDRSDGSWWYAIDGAGANYTLFKENSIQFDVDKINDALDYYRNN